LNTKTKIVGVSTLKRKLSSIRRKKKIAFTNGCFDILHGGHISYLEKAKKTGRILVVGLNSDSSVRKIKGPSRPINSQLQRAHVLAALACIDYVTIFDEETPYQLIKAIKPDVLIKGADWKDKKVVGGDIVKFYGGKIELIRYIPKMSTTSIIKRASKTCKRK